MKTVTLKVLAKDCRTSNYLNIWDCPVFRAAKRAGLPVRAVGGWYLRLDNGKQADFTNFKEVSKMCTQAKEEKAFSFFKRLFTRSKVKNFEIQVTIPD